MIMRHGLGSPWDPGTNYVVDNSGNTVDCNKWMNYLFNFACGAESAGIDISPQGSQTNPLSSWFSSLTTPIILAIAAGVVVVVVLARR